MVWLAGEAEIKTNSASLAGAGLSLAINLEMFEKKIFGDCISVVTSVFSNYSRKYQKCFQLFRDAFMNKNDFYLLKVTINFIQLDV